MALTQVDFDLSEEDQIVKFSKKWKLNKPKTVRRMILTFKEEVEYGAIR